MRRHPNRVSPHFAKRADGKPLNARQRVQFPRNSKRGPKDRRRLWPTLDYIIVKGHGVLFLEPKTQTPEG